MSCGNLHYPPMMIREELEDGFWRGVEFKPGYDCMAKHGEAGRKCHGRHGMNLRFLWGNAEGVVQLLLFASDWLPGSMQHGSTKPGLAKLGLMAADLGHHWSSPTYEGEMKMDCDLLDGKRCFYDGSGMNAERPAERFLTEGLPAVWEELQAYWDDTAAALSPQEGEQ